MRPQNSTGTAMSGLTASDPRTVGPYRVLGRLGVGGMGVVYLAESSQGQRVAVKVVRPEIADQPHFRTRFAREVRAATTVAGTYTATVLDSDTDTSPQWIATEYVPGPTLAEHVETHGRMPEDQVRLLALGLAEAIAAIHAVGLIHRDLKPSNVILSADGPKVIDFGISQAADATSLTQTGVYVGSLAWMSPEQVTGEDLSPATDMFSLGLLLAYASSAQHPYGVGRPEAVAFRMVNQAPVFGELPPSLQSLIGQLLSKSPSNRPTPEAVISGLSEGATQINDITRVMSLAWDATVVGHYGVEEPVRQSLPATTPKQRRRRLAAAVIGGSSIIVASALFATGTVSLSGPSDAEAAPRATPSPTQSPTPTTTPIPTPATTATPQAIETDNAAAATYAVLGVSPLQVLEAPYLSSRSVGEVSPGDGVRVECTAQGEAVTQDNGIDNRQWNYITAPFTGYVPDAFIDSGGVVAPQPECEFVPPPPDVPDSPNQTFVVESLDPANDFSLTTDQRYSFTVLEDPYWGLGLRLTDPATGLEYWGFPDLPLSQPLGESGINTRLLSPTEVAARIDEITALRIPLFDDHPLNPTIRVTSTTAAKVAIDPNP